MSSVIRVVAQKPCNFAQRLAIFSETGGKMKTSTVRKKIILADELSRRPLRFSPNHGPL